MKCLLCESTGLRALEQLGDQRRFFKCAECKLIFLDPALRLSPEQEKQRYLEHNNDIHDPNYQKFVSPLVELVKNNFPVASRGLDFGSGTGPVLTHLLKQEGYEVLQYDVYFSAQEDVLQSEFDFIVSCEVVEHLYDPAKEFRNLAEKLKPGGWLAVMTLLYQDEDLFKWFYSRDPTHVVFFSKPNLEWIQKNAGFSSVNIHSSRLVSFIK